MLLRNNYDIMISRNNNMTLLRHIMTYNILTYSVILLT